ncbi:MAG: primosomal protein N', partial [Betaproteobacteria bacterium]
MTLLRIALPVPVFREFDYLAPDIEGDCIGRCVRVRLGPRRLVGVVVDTPAESAVPADSLAMIDGYADDLPAVPPDVLELAKFAADYYQYPLGLTLQHAVPPRGRARTPLRAGAPLAYRLTETGRGAMQKLPARAHVQQRMATALLASPIS